MHKQLQDLLETEKRFDLINTFEPQESVLADVAKMSDSIRKAQKAVSELPNQIDQLREYRCPTQIAFSSVINAESRSKLNDLEIKQDEWVEQYLTPVENSISYMSASRCSGWLSQTQTLPDFLSKQITI